MSAKARVAAAAYPLFRALFRAWTRLCYRLEVDHADRCPAEGGVVVVANHQSFLDPVLLGVALPRRLIYTPRATLQRSLAYRLFTAVVDVEHVERDGRDVGAARRLIERLRAGDAIALFPEQTRTADGSLGPISPGFAMLAERSGAPVLPVRIDGAFEAWPRTRSMPRLRGRIRVRVGEPFQVDAAGRREAAARLERILLDLGGRPARAVVDDAVRTGEPMN